MEEEIAAHKDDVFRVLRGMFGESVIEKADDEDEQADAEDLCRTAHDEAAVAGFVLVVKYKGWVAFCERQGIPALASWKPLAAFDRLQRTLAQAEAQAFDAAGMLAWLNTARPNGDGPMTEMPLTAEREADAIAFAHRDRIAWWTGS
jgi:hypothetical protein